MGLRVKKYYAFLPAGAGGGGGGCCSLAATLSVGNNAGGLQIKNLADGTLAKDAVTLEQLNAFTITGTPFGIFYADGAGNITDDFSVLGGIVNNTLHKVILGDFVNHAGYYYYAPASAGAAGNEVGVVIDMLNAHYMLKDHLAVESIDWNLRKAFDHNGTASINYDDGFLIDQFGTNPVEWKLRALSNNAGIQVLDWSSLLLEDNAGTTVLDWNLKLLKNVSGTLLNWAGNTLKFPSTPTFANDAAAGIGGLTAGAVYQTGLVGGISFLAIKQ